MRGIQVRWCEPTLSVCDVRVGDEEAGAADPHYRFGPTRFSVIPRLAIGAPRSSLVFLLQSRVCALDALLGPILFLMHSSCALLRNVLQPGSLYVYNANLSGCVTGPGLSRLQQVADPIIRFLTVSWAINVFFSANNSV
jgi:hypothetical protein